MPLTTYTAGQVLTASSLNANFAFAAANGLVCVKEETAFTAVTSVTVDGVFSSTYTNYLVLGRYTTTTTNGLLRMRVGGVAATGADYNLQGLEANSTGVNAFRDASQTSFLAFNSTTGDFKSSYQLNFFSPFKTEPTNIQLEVDQNLAAYTAPFLRSYRGNHNAATSYDGFQFAVASGTMTGNYAVYGYAKA